MKIEYNQVAEMINKTLPPLVDLQHQQELLRKEYEYEKEMYRRQSERVSLQKRITQGICWYPLSVGRSFYNSLNQLAVEIERRTDKEVEHNFDYGRPICFFTSDFNGNLKYLNFSATISYVQDDRMVVILPTSSALNELQSSQEDLGVQLYFDETSYKTMFAALTEVSQAKGNKLALLRDALLGQGKAEEKKLFPIRFPWLNASQEVAVNKVLAAKQVSIVHGPPGTGKTTTLVEAIYETLHRENQVLVCAQSNTAVDWISEKLIDRGIHVLRIGNPTRVNDKMLSFTYERRFEAHPDYAELWSIRKAIREIQSNMRKRSREERDTIRNRLSRLKLRATELEVKIDMDLFNEAHVIACTLVGSANRVMTNHHFTTLFIDEAAQALEAACWIAISKADRVIFAGDYQQLPPTVKCPEAARGGLSETLMQKVAIRKPDMVSLLKIQYRMHEDIMNFSSQCFYGGALKSAPEVCHRGILRLDTPIVWIDTSECDFSEGLREETLSRINKKEAILLVERLKSYIESISKERVIEEQIDFGLISPYKAQVQYIRGLIRRDVFFRPLKQLITVHTVDGFQGQERDVILISLVRANDEGRIGFLEDLRRMNVAVTRARMKLIVVGDASTLTHHAFYKKLYDYISERGKIEKINIARQDEI